MTKRLSLEAYKEGILAQNRFILSRAITLVESHLEADNRLASDLVESILGYAGQSLRIGITGVPGVGKSTFVESFGMLLATLGKRVAVLAIDPTSPLTQGSILGDKTRMEHLSRHPLAFIRPSPAGSSLGGVSRKTRESMLLCEAAGYEVILVETVGVGQSEVAVNSMVDFFLLLMLAGAGDELQGIKKGIMEMADAVVINKADGDNQAKAKAARAEYQAALHLFAPTASAWIPQVLTCSALQAEGLEKIWEMIEQYQRLTQQNGFFYAKRQAQNKEWMHQVIKERLEQQFYQHQSIKTLLQDSEEKVGKGTLHAIKAALELLSLYEHLKH